MDTSSRNADAQPILLSFTVIRVSLWWKSSDTVGRLLMNWRSTEKPTPVPHIRI